MRCASRSKGAAEGHHALLAPQVYGLPIVRDVAKYGEVLRDIRQGQVKQILWFFDPGRVDPFRSDGRCLIRWAAAAAAAAVVVGPLAAAHRAVRLCAWPCVPAAHCYGQHAHAAYHNNKGQVMLCCGVRRVMLTCSPAEACCCVCLWPGYLQVQG
jgi:hypothetical protein